MSIIAQTPPTSVSLPTEETISAPSEEPPDTSYRHSLPFPIAVRGTTSSAQVLKNEQDRKYGVEASTSPTVSYSPYMADSTGGSASDYEHEMDSPSSLSSWNSWAGGRRGDLADVEDLELDGTLGGEPELETVSELDEESSSFCSGSDRAGMDSDEEVKHQKMGLLGLGFDTSISRRKNVRVGGQFNDVSHSHHVHHASNQHHYHHHPPGHQQNNLHTPPSFPHFSPRAGGHGLSHASRYSLRAPPNLAARRRKGRIAELAEEGGGEPINTTVMPQKISNTKRTSKGTENKHIDADATLGGGGGDTTADEDDVHRSQTETEVEQEGEGEGGDGRSPSTPTLHSSSHSWNEFEFIGPPAIPVRCVSPSETVPVVPSPLCVCLTAEENGVLEEKATEATSAGESKAVVEEDTTIRVKDSTPISTSKRPSSPPSPTTSGKSEESFPSVTVSTPPTSPPASPQLARKTSRGRRSSSPGRVKPKMPLRPCFRRRASAQVGTLNRRESSSERETNGENSSSSSTRGRVQVRFSEAPPTEVRTHSPVEYDRKACPISNRLSASDVAELRGMKMEMGLLEAKWAAMAACKSPDANTEDEESEGENFYPPNPSQLLMPVASSSSSSSNPLLSERRRADSISSSSPTRFCKSRFSTKDANVVSPADHLRMEREKERERACRLAGIGTGIGFRYSGAGGPSPRQLHHGGSKTPGACNSMISRFGLSKPPPPLPGMPASPTKPTFEGGSSLYRPNSAPPIQNEYYDSPRANSAEIEEDFRGRSMDKGSIRSLNESTSTDGTVTESSRSTSKSIPELIQTSPSPHSSPDRSSTLSTSPLNQHPVRPSIQPYQLAPIDKNTTTPSHSPPSSANVYSNSSSMCGYDSPASEFYESGSEYDLIG